MAESVLIGHLVVLAAVIAALALVCSDGPTEALVLAATLGVAAAGRMLAAIALLT